jgi:membrane-associated phospholipid phosphatase
MRSNLRKIGIFSLASILILVTFTTTIASFASSGPTASKSAASITGQIEPKAGTWQTWVLTSGSQLRLSAPPDKAATDGEIKQLKEMVAKRDAAALDQIAYWDTGSPSYRWNDIAVNEALKNNWSGPSAIRILALMHVAIYDGLVASWDSKYTFNRPRPSEIDPSLTTVIANPQSPAYPSEYAVAAGAASTVLAYAFPDDAAFFIQRAQDAGQSRLMAGVEYPSDVQAGLALGQKIGALVVAVGKADGSDAKWTGSVPTEKGKWTGTDPAFVTLGTWKTWVLTSGSQFRPGPPPAYDSDQEKAELAEVENYKRTPKTNADAYYWQFAVSAQRNFQFWSDVLDKKLFEYRMDSNAPRTARAYALLYTTYGDSGIACFDAKYTYWAMRPFQLDPKFQPLFTTPNHPSYPSAHSCLTAAAGSILGYLFPRDIDMLNGMVVAAGEARISSGIHFRTDVVVGQKLGRQVAQVAIDRAKSDGS